MAYLWPVTALLTHYYLPTIVHESEADEGHAPLQRQELERAQGRRGLQQHASSTS